MDAVAAARDLVSDLQLRSDRTNGAGGGAMHGLEPVSTVECSTKEEATYSLVSTDNLGVMAWSRLDRAQHAVSAWIY
jgi:hypothetical protein